MVMNIDEEFMQINSTQNNQEINNNNFKQITRLVMNMQRQITIIN